MDPRHDGASKVTTASESSSDRLPDRDRGIIVNSSDMTADLLPKRKRKKRSNRPAAQRGLNKPTGFEDNFADAPLTSKQYLELRELYNPELPFVERVLRAIHRFERTRKLSNERRDIFFKYLSYGGFDTSPNMFQGQQDPISMEDHEAITIMGQAGLSVSMRDSIYDVKKEGDKSHNAQHDPQYEGQRGNDVGIEQDRKLDKRYKYVVDFHGTMCAFLSRRATALYGLNSKEMVDLVTTTLERFMDYLLQHEVCSEYKQEILQARNLCRHARTEFYSCMTAQRWLPGDFNIACSTLSGGSYATNYDGSTYWGDIYPGEKVFKGLTVEKARQVVGFAMAATADDQDYDQYASWVCGGANFAIVRTIRGHGFEIVNIERATAECYQVYCDNTDEYKPVGKIQARFWRNPESPPEDLTREEGEALQSAVATTRPDALPRLPLFDGTITFLLEDSDILSHLKVGQKVQCAMHQLNIGTWFFDEFIRLYPSFDLWIENELTFDWKEPRPLNEALDLSEADAIDKEAVATRRNPGDNTENGLEAVEGRVRDEEQEMTDPY